MKKITSLILLMFLTLASYGQILSTGFENGVPPGWQITNNGNGVNVPWVINNTSALAHSGNSCLMVAPQVGTVANPIEDWAITSVVNLNGIINPKVSFYGKVAPGGPTQNTKLEVKVSTTPSDLASFTTIATFQDFNTGATNPISPVGGTYGFQELSLLQYTGQNIYVAFVMTSTGNGKTWFLDDVTIFEDCPDATNLGIIDIGATTATATWQNPLNAQGFQIDVMLASENPTTYTADYTSTTTSQVLSNLEPNTLYKYYIRSVCADQAFGDWIGPLTFGTTPTPAPLPYVENFENYHGWQFINGTQVNKWFVGTAAHNGGANSLYISNNNGVNNTYTIGTSSVTQAYRDILIPSTGAQMQVAFDWRAVGEGTTTLYDYFRVWLVPATFTPTAGTQITAANSGGIQIGGSFNQQANWVNYNGIVDVSGMLGSTRRLIFEWRNDASGGTQPPAAIDNINLKIITCSTPTNLVVSAITQTSATVTWTVPTTSIPASYDYFVSQTNTPPTDTTVPTGNVVGATITLNDLQPGQIYYVWVRGNCGTTNGNSNLLGPGIFNTVQIPATLPYIESFDSPGVVFGLNNGTQVNKWMIGTDTFLSPGSSLYISNNNLNNVYTTTASSVTQAYRDVSIPAAAGEMQISFDWKAMGEGTTTDILRVWLVPSTFTPTVGTQITAANSGGIQVGGNLSQQTNWVNFNTIINVSSMANSNRKLVFEWRNDTSAGTQPPAAIDNINLKIITCSAPSNLVLTSVTQSTAVVSWTAPANTVPTSYDYFVSQTNTPPTDTTVPTGNVTGTTLTLNDLQPGQTYYVWIRGNCGATNGNSLLLGPLTVVTTQIPATLPYTENFDTPGFVFGLNNGTQVNKWMIGSDTFLSPNNSLYISNNNLNNVYSTSTSSVTQAYRDIQIPTGAGEMQVAFDWKGMGEGTADILRVWLVPTTFVPTPGTQITTANSGGVQVGGNLNQQTNWVNFSSIINVSTFSNSNRRLVFEWRNDAFGGTQPPAAVDNISLKIVTCSAPSNLVLTSVNQSTAVLTWTAPTNTVPASYDYFVSQTNTPPADTAIPTGNVTGTTVTINDLQPGQTYYVWVRGNCGATNGNSVLLGPLVIQTTQVPATLPYNENFDSPSFVFGFNNGTQVNKWMVGSDTFLSPDKSLYISNNNLNNLYTTTTTSVTHAFREISIPASAIQLNLNFDFKGMGEGTSFVYDYMRVWVVPSNFNSTPGTQITAGNSGGVQVGGNINQVATYQNFNFEFNVPTTLIGQNAKLVFEWRNDSSGGTQPPASVDNISLVVLTCPAPSNIQTDVSCSDQSVVNISWTPGGLETSWEYTVLPVNSPQPTSGIIVNEPEVIHSGLNPNTDYRVWLRAVCGGEDGNSVWVGQNFNASASPVASANPFCAGPEGIVFPNVHDGMGVPDLVTGSFHCLASTPNPVWYYLKVDQAGQLNFQIVQNTQFNDQGVAVGSTLDVDFIAFGPFEDLAEACSDIIIAPGSPNPNSKIVGCSYSSSATENFSIANAQPGQIYVILITNYDGDPGFIKLIQTNADAPNSGNTDCNFLCEVTLGPDRVLCNEEDYTLTAGISTVGIGDVTSIEWFFNGDLMDPTVYNTLSIVVNQSGEYTVVLEKENCETGVPITDTVNITFGNSYDGIIPSDYTLCDVGNDGIEIFDLDAFSNSFLGPNLYSVSYYGSLNDATNQVDPISSLYESSPTNIFIRISDIDNFLNCPRIQEVELKLVESIIPIVDFDYLAPICVNGQNSILPIVPNDFTFGGVFSSSEGLFINQSTGEIDLDSSLAGDYEIKYDVIFGPGTCGESKSYSTNVKILDRIGFIIDGYCKDSEYTISAKDILGTLDFETATFKWSNNVASSDKDVAKVNKEGVYTLTVTTAEGCVEIAEIVVNDTYCQIPKGISPNGDGINDSFVLNNFIVQKIQIFNRYGKEVYSHGLGYTNQWHGQSSNGDLLSSGTYFYSIVTPFETFTGWIQVTREIK